MITAKKKIPNLSVFESEGCLGAMQILEALALLGLHWNDRENKDAIRAAWKRKICAVHPDKNDSHDATKKAQVLNEAKETLLGQSESEFDKIFRERQEEMQAKKKMDESKKQEEETSKREHDAFLQRLDEYERKAREIKRERYNKNRKHRAPDSRAHRKIDDYPEGKNLIEEMKSFFNNNFVSKNGSPDHLFVRDIMDHFVSSRDVTSDLEKRLFQRHSKQILISIWPNAKYSKYNNKRCFLNVGIKQ